jgi:hyaluronoglucosaminidase
LAALFWNNKNYSENAQTVWEDAFRYLEPEVEDSYFKIASNVSNCPHSSRIGNGFPESEYLKDTLASVLNKINSGAALKNDSEVESLISEMDKIVAAVADFKENCTNTKLVQELNPWLSSLNDVATGIKAILKSAQALQENDAEEAWTNFGTAAKALNMWNTYNTGDGTTKAEAGSKR